MRLIIISILTLVGATSSAQFISGIKIGVNGLTCSACTRSVEMSLLRLDFIDSVSMSLENTEGLIYSKKLYPVDFNKIAQAVTDAGFSVRFLEARLNLSQTEISETGCFTLAGLNFQWLGYHKGTQPKTFAFIDKAFLPGRESSKWKKKMSNSNCYDGKSVFHITNVED